jgi:hypothetical protein
MSKYQYIERDVATMMGRRGFLKVIALCAVVVAAAGAAITKLVQSRNEIIRDRQDGLYADDKRLQKMKLTSSHENDVCWRVYKDMNGKPVEGEMYKLNHTHYYARSQLAMKGDTNHV